MLGREAVERATKSLSFDLCKTLLVFFLNPPVAYEMQPVPYNF